MLKFIKKFILIIGVILLLIVFFNNILFTVTISRDEIATIKLNSFFMPLLLAILVAIEIYIICNLLNQEQIKTKTKIILFSIFIIIYLIAQVLFIYEKQEIVPQADQEIAYNLAVSMKEGTTEEFINQENMFEATTTNKVYFERYKQQITLAFIWQLLFRLFQTNSYTLIEWFNVFGNALTLISILLICKELSKKYNINKCLATVLAGTFVSLIYLVTFVYGDISGLGFAMLGVYFIIKYVSSKKVRFALLSAISCSIAYMLRMNFLIFILAILIYLFLDLIDKDSYSENEREENNRKLKGESENINSKNDLENINAKNNLNDKEENHIKIKNIIKKLLLILCFIVITFMPTNMVENYYCRKFNIDEKKSFQLTGYLYMGMSESHYAPGWYSYYIADSTFKDYEKANQLFKDGINERINFFKNNPKYMLNFYEKKICSMWVENTYQSTFYNKVYDRDEGLENKTETQTIRLYQKALVFIIFGCALAVLLQNRKSLSNEVILLLTIFIGGFLFHLLWEAKSRYVIPYIVALIPIASIEISKIKLNKKCSTSKSIIT